MKKKGKLEHEIQNECLDVLNLFGIYHWRQNTGAFRTSSGSYFRSSMPGISDILGIMPDGRLLAIECKREIGGIVSQDQKAFLEAVSRNHGLAIVRAELKGC